MSATRDGLRTAAAAAGLLLTLGCRLPVVTPQAPLRAPENLAVWATSSASISVSWAGVENAEGYVLHRSASEGGPFARVTADAVSGTSYEDTGLEPGTVYWYRVAALRGGTAQTFCAPVSGTTNLSGPGGLAVRALCPRQLQISWDAVAGADGYNVYRSESPSGWQAKLNTDLVVEPTYTDQDLAEATGYWYEVAAVRGGREQDRSGPAGGVTMLGAPAGVQVTYAAAGTLRLSWDALAGAEGYDVLRGDSAAGPFTRVNVSPQYGTSFDDTGLAADTLYWYQVVGARDGIAQTPSAAVRGLTAQLWARSFGGIDVEQAKGAVPTADGGFAVAGTSDSFTYYHGVLWITKLGAGGGIEWQKAYERFLGTVAIEQTPDGGYLVGGRGLDMWSTYDFMVLRLDAAGGVTWVRRVGRSSPGSDTLTCIRQTADGGCIAGGTLHTTPMVMKFDAEGGVSWARMYTGLPTGAPAAIAQTGDGGYVVGGRWLMKLAANGDVTWAKTYDGTSGGLSATGIEQTLDGGYIVSGSIAGDLGVLRLDAAGAISWQMAYPGASSSGRLRQTGDGGCLLAASGWGNVWLLKLDAGGAVSWQRMYGGSGTEELASAVTTGDGGFIVAGTTSSYGAGGADTDCWILKIPGSGTLPGAEFCTDTSATPYDAGTAAADVSVTPQAPSLWTATPILSVTDTNATVKVQYP